MSYMPPLQVIWLLVYWAGLGPVLMLLSIGLARGVAFENALALTIALIAAIIGSVWATRLGRLHVDSVAFVKGTTTIRVIAIAWLVIGAYLVVAPVLSVVMGIELGDDGMALGFVSTVGSVSMLAVLGPGYAEYREAKATVKPAVPAAASEVPAAAASDAPHGSTPAA